MSGTEEKIARPKRRRPECMMPAYWPKPGAAPPPGLVRNLSSEERRARFESIVSQYLNMVMRAVAYLDIEGLKFAVELLNDGVRNALLPPVPEADVSQMNAFRGILYGITPPRRTRARRAIPKTTVNEVTNGEGATVIPIDRARRANKPKTGPFAGGCEPS